MDTAEESPITIGSSAEKSVVENSSNKNLDAPVVRRRRRIVRHHVREKTPEPSAKTGGIKQKYSDDDEGGGGGGDVSASGAGGSSSETNNSVKTKSRRINTAANASTNTEVRPISVAAEDVQQHQKLETAAPPVKSAAISAHHSKILSRRDRSVTGSSAIRSQSTPRDESKIVGESAITTLIRHAKRSLSSPR